MFFEGTKGNILHIHISGLISDNALVFNPYKLAKLSIAFVQPESPFKMLKVLSN